MSNSKSSSRISADAASALKLFLDAGRELDGKFSPRLAQLYNRFSRFVRGLTIEYKNMARSLANIMYRSMMAFPASRSNHVLRFSTTLPNDPDTHEDFRPTCKIENSGLSLDNIVEQNVKANPVMIYMKGVPDLPRCGFSALAVQVLMEYNVPLSARNILEDPGLKNAVKAFSHWPTFPQIFINGEFIGGSDIILNMHQTGELKEKLSKVSEEKQ